MMSAFDNLMLPMCKISSSASCTAVINMLSDIYGIAKEDIRLLDILYYAPNKIIRRNNKTSLQAAVDGEAIIVVVEVDNIFNVGNNKNYIKISCHNETGTLSIMYFNGIPAFIKSRLLPRKKVAISGIVSRYGKECRITHPTHVEEAINISRIPIIEILYHTPVGITKRMMNVTLKNAKELLSACDLGAEWIDENIMQQTGWLSWKESMIKLHNPTKSEDLEAESLHIKRLAYDEALAEAIAIGIAMKSINQTIFSGAIIKQEICSLRKKLLKLLPFELTSDQKIAITDIENDLSSGRKMVRLLYGDVGTGKTLVAFYAALSIIGIQQQVAFIVPTSILAKQHYETISKFANELGIKVTCLLGGATATQRKPILKSLADGTCNLVIGTHALIQDDIVIKSLGLAIIDEQHKFGVKQRIKLSDKGGHCHTLFLSATPIPRTLALHRYFSAVPASYLRSKPAGRQPIDTRVMSVCKVDEFIEAIANSKQNNKILWICPLIENSESINAVNVTDRFCKLVKSFGENSVFMLHGKMKQTEKEDIIDRFTKDEDMIKIMVTTSIVEIGIDVPTANIAIVENAERFGLAQLHQMRGRVGRSNIKSYCILFYGIASQKTMERLNVLKQTNDGDKIAEADLKIRGSGTIYGIKQSGFYNYRILDQEKHMDIIEESHRQAISLLESNGVDSPKIQTLLKIFNFDKTYKNTAGG